MRHGGGRLRGGPGADGRVHQDAGAVRQAHRHVPGGRPAGRRRLRRHRGASGSRPGRPPRGWPPGCPPRPRWRWPSTGRPRAASGSCTPPRTSTAASASTATTRCTAYFLLTEHIELTLGGARREPAPARQASWPTSRPDAPARLRSEACRQTQPVAGQEHARLGVAGVAVGQSVERRRVVGVGQVGHLVHEDRVEHPLGHDAQPVRDPYLSRVVRARAPAGRLVGDPAHRGRSGPDQVAVAQLDGPGQQLVVAVPDRRRCRVMSRSTSQSIVFRRASGSDGRAATPRCFPPTHRASDVLRGGR